MNRAALPLAAAVLLVAACATPPVPEAELPPVPEAPAPAAEPEVAVALPPEEPGPPPVPVIEAAALADLTRVQVAALLGTPNLLREEPGAEVLLYVGESCAVHVFLYEPAAGGARKVAHVEVVAPSGSCAAGGHLVTR